MKPRSRPGRTVLLGKGWPPAESESCEELGDLLPRSVDSERESRGMEPRERSNPWEPSEFRKARQYVRVVTGKTRRPTGVEGQGERALGSHRNLGGLAISAENEPETWGPDDQVPRLTMVCTPPA